jgi:hypothetical protein
LFNTQRKMFTTPQYISNSDVFKWIENINFLFWIINEEKVGESTLLFAIFINCWLQFETSCHYCNVYLSQFWNRNYLSVEKLCLSQTFQHSLNDWLSESSFFFFIRCRMKLHPC